MRKSHRFLADTNYLWFSNPKDFNDPYDLNLNLILPNYNRGDILLLINLFKEKGIVFDINDEDLINRFVSNPNFMKERLQEVYIQSLVPKIGGVLF